MDNIKQGLTGESGFTVIELLIALQLGILVIGFTYLSFGFFQQYLHMWQQQQQLESDIAFVSTIITQKLDGIHYLQAADRDSMVGFSADGVIVLKWGQLSCNGLSVLPENFTVINHQVTYCLVGKSRLRQMLRKEMVDKTQLAAIRAVELQLELQSGEKLQKINIVARLARLQGSVRQ